MSVDDRSLTEKEIVVLKKTFPELSWMENVDWQRVGAYSGWRDLFDDWLFGTLWPGEPEVLSGLKSKEARRGIRNDCRDYFGEENVPNINDPDDPTWA
jgi:hypothetical protein